MKDKELIETGGVSMEKKHTARIFSNDFNRIVAATKSFVAGKDTYRITSQYIRLEFNAENSRVTAIAVDGYRMSVEHAVISDCDTDFSVYIRGDTKLPIGLYATFEAEDNEVIVRCGDFIFGYRQPHGEFLDWEKALPQSDINFRIGFNGNYLLSALQAAKVSLGNSFRNPVVLEFRGPLEPVLLRTNNDDIKMVLPIRIKEG